VRTLLRECGERVRRGIVVYQGVDQLAVDGVEILPVATFLDEMYAGRLL
jgi:hypothetical protein